VQLSRPARRSTHPDVVTLALLCVFAVTGCTVTSAATNEPKSVQSEGGADSGARISRDVEACSKDEEPIAAHFANGNSWELCWSIAADVGLSIRRATFETDEGATPVLAEASLAQIHVPYDDGSISELDMPVFGTTTSDLSKEICPDQIYESESGALCASITDDGLRYAWSDLDFETGDHTGRGQCLQIFTMTPVNWYTYLNQWLFCDEGSVKPSVGAGGKLAPQFFGDDHTGEPLGAGSSDNRLSHFHNVFWRLRFDLGQSRVTLVSTDQDQARVSTTETAINSEQALVEKSNTNVRVESTRMSNADGHVIAYDLDHHNDAPYRDPIGAPYTAADIYVTQDRDCERLAAQNPTEEGCSSSVDTFVNAEAIQLPVLWVQVGFHHIPRDEDQPVMNEHWQGFSMTPRSLTTKNHDTKHLD